MLRALCCLQQPLSSPLTLILISWNYAVSLNNEELRSNDLGERKFLSQKMASRNPKKELLQIRVSIVLQNQFF